jgi:hypothetical protein
MASLTFDLQELPDAPRVTRVVKNAWRGLMRVLPNQVGSRCPHQHVCPAWNPQTEIGCEALEFHQVQKAYEASSDMTRRPHDSEGKVLAQGCIFKITLSVRPSANWATPRTVHRCEAWQEVVRSDTFATAFWHRRSTQLGAAYKFYFQRRPGRENMNSTGPSTISLHS